MCKETKKLILNSNNGAGKRHRVCFIWIQILKVTLGQEILLKFAL